MKQEQDMSKTVLIKNLRCSEAEGQAIMDELREMAHDGHTVPESVSLAVANMAASRHLRDEDDDSI